MQWNGAPLTTSHPVGHYGDGDRTRQSDCDGRRRQHPTGQSVRRRVQHSHFHHQSCRGDCLSSLSPSSVAAGSVGVFADRVRQRLRSRLDGVMERRRALATSLCQRDTVNGIGNARTWSAYVRESAASVTVLNPGGAESNSVTIGDRSAASHASSRSRPLPPPRAAPGEWQLSSQAATSLPTAWYGGTAPRSETTFTDTGHVSATVPASLLVNAGRDGDYGDQPKRPGGESGDVHGDSIHARGRAE